MAYLPENPNEWPSSILTRKQRERLRQGFDPDRAADDTMKARIRTRAQAGLLDLALLLDELPHEEVKKVFRDPDPPNNIHSPIASSIPSVLGLLYLGGLDREVSSPSQSEGWYFADGAEVGIQHALNTLGIEVKDVNVDIEVDRGSSFEQLATGDLSSYPNYLLSQMLATEAITHKEYAAAITQRNRSSSSEE